jgi:hypothetical protein
MRDLLQEQLLATLEGNAATARRMAELEGEVRAGLRTPVLAVDELLERMDLRGRRAKGEPL